MANRHGGRIILGINNDGTFEGKGIFEIDSDKGSIDNISQTMISPSIDYLTEFIECDEGDVLIIDVQKRKGIPHAFINTRHGPEINNRIYYIRTEHGKRLVSDSQLEWLFKNQEDPNFSFPFSFNINYFRENFQISPIIPQPSIFHNFNDFICMIPDEDIAKLKENSEDIHAFFVQISPYVLLLSFAWVFSHSWIIQVNRRKGKTSWTANRKISNIKEFSVDDIPKPNKNSILSQLTWDFSLVLHHIIFQPIYLPDGTTIEIRSENKGYSSKLLFTHSEFNFTITFNFSSTSPGLYSSHPYAILQSEQISSDDSNPRKYFQYIDIDGRFDASFEYPEHNIDSFKDYYHLANSIKEILQNEWDFDNFSQELPPKEFYSIEAKLENIQTILNEFCKK
jgi:hypothetical protein